MKQFILEKGYNSKYGARPLRRAIQKYIEDEVSEAYLKGMLKEKSNVTVTVDDNGKTELNIM